MHPRQVLLDAQSRFGLLPVCDHYCGVEARIRKSLALQAQMSAEFGACVFDVTLDCEDGAPVGLELAHAQMVVELVRQARSANAAAPDPSRVPARVAARVHPVAHPVFDQDVQTIIGGAGALLCHLMIPKVESLADVERAARAVDQASGGWAAVRPLPLHVLIESPLAVHRAYEIAAHPRVQSLSFGLMDFVAAHGGAIPASAMAAGVSSAPHAPGQFAHPLVLNAKVQIAAACHAFGKTPSHCVVTELHDDVAMREAARRAARELGYTRMWSIHPSQIRPLLCAVRRRGRGGGRNHSGSATRTVGSGQGCRPIA